MKKMGSIMLFLAIAGISLASLTNLPDSSYYSGKSHFTGGYVEFAVYDTQTYPSEFVIDYGVSTTCRYVYAYQVFSTSIDISYFVIEGITAGAVTSSNVTTIQDLNGTGVDATDKYLSASTTKAIYEFDGGILVSSGNSYLLLLYSNYSPGVGTYSIEAPDDNEIPVANGDESSNVPEPATVGLLLIGAVSMLRRKKLA